MILPDQLIAQLGILNKYGRPIKCFMKRSNSDIKQQFNFYEDLVHGQKVIRHSPIILDPKPNNTYWLSGDSVVVDHFFSRVSNHIISCHLSIDSPVN